MPYIAYATEQVWNENFSEDNINVNVELSYDYWVKTSDSTNTNLTYTYSVASGVLTMTLQASGDFGSQALKFDRKIGIEDDVTVKIKAMWYGDSGSRAFAYWKDADTVVFNIYVKPDNTLWIEYYHTNGTKINKQLATITVNKWYYITIAWTQIPNEYGLTITPEDSNTALVDTTIQDSLYGLSDATFCRIEYSSGVTSGNLFSRYYIDYIKHSSVASVDTSILTDILPAIVSLACLGIAIGFIKKVAK